MPIVDKNGKWWLGAKTKDDWFLQVGDEWYIFKGGKLQRPKDTKDKTKSQSTQYKVKDQLGIRYVTYRYLAILLFILLGISFGLNIWMFLRVLGIL
jgi:hypothetical protein